ncbi:MAG: amino acid permease [Bacteroidales bacterium]
MARTTNKFGTAPVFFTAISTILGAILFLRFGFAVGKLGFIGVLAIIALGHMVTIPTAMAISEISTNQRVKGGGEYYIISRSFGLNIGTTIGIALFLSQAISVAFYVIAFTEAFEFFFNWIKDTYGVILPRQAISLPAMAILAYLILKKGANLGVKTLYFVVGILAVSLLMFFFGHTEYSETARAGISENPVRNFDDFFIIFAIIFPAFTGMTAGVGLSGDLKNPGKSIPKGTLIATSMGFVIYILVALKLVHSARPEDLVNIQLIMSEIAYGGNIIIPLGLAASTISSALGSVMVAPRTLQALGVDQAFPSRKLNFFLAKGDKETNEPFNASLLTILIAFIFVAAGDVNAVASIISMFFMVTYGSICLISFLNHFGAPPSYRPTFKSNWVISLLGFIFAVFLMFKISALYAGLAIVMIILLYTYISYYHKERQGLEAIFRSTLFQINRNLQIYLQKSQILKEKISWHPSVVCVSDLSSERDNAFNLLKWFSYKYGFGTYIKYIPGYLSNETYQKSKKAMDDLIEKTYHQKSNVYVDTIISPSYTSAIAQIIQLPGVSGLENNMILFEFEKNEPANLNQIVENISLVKAAHYDICVLGGSNKGMNYYKGIHIWIRKFDLKNINLMILLSYIIAGHPDWKKSGIKIFFLQTPKSGEESKNQLTDVIKKGRLPVSMKNIEFIETDEETNPRDVINEKSQKAGLTMMGFLNEQLKHEGEKIFSGYDKLGDVLFVNATIDKQIK